MAADLDSGNRRGWILMIGRVIDLLSHPTIGRTDFEDMLGIELCDKINIRVLSGGMIGFASPEYLCPDSAPMHVLVDVSQRFTWKDQPLDDIAVLIQIKLLNWKFDHTCLSKMEYMRVLSGVRSFDGSLGVW